MEMDEWVGGGVSLSCCDDSAEGVRECSVEHAGLGLLVQTGDMNAPGWRKDGLANDWAARKHSSMDR